MEVLLKRFFKRFKNLKIIISKKYFTIEKDYMGFLFKFKNRKLKFIQNLFKLLLISHQRKDKNFFMKLATMNKNKD